MATIKSLRVREPVLVLCLSLAACGSPTPVTTVGASGSGSGASALPSGSAGPSFDQATMVDAAQAEVDEVQRLRAEAGIAALIGPAGPTVLKNVDEAKVANAAKTLPLVAAELGLDLTAVAPRIASVRLPPPAARTRDDIEWTGSLVGQVSATTSMMMALLPTAIANLAGQAADARGGAPIDNTETYTPTPHDGVSEKVTIRTRVIVRAGGGRVALDLDINSVDTITDTATGREISRLEGNAHGHIDVNGCPDPDGVAEGSYELSLQEELVTSGSSGTGAGDTKVVKAPFKLIDGEDAHLISIEGNLNITAHAHGPGAAGSDPFDWSVGATLSETIPVSGSTTTGVPSVQTNGDPTQAQIDRTTGGRRSAEDYLKVLGRETEKFWRSGECIKLKPSRDSGKVKPQEEIKLSVDSLGAFDGQQISAKIKAAFTGKESLDPKDTPVDPPAIFTFKAGQQKDDKGTIDLLQTGKRGIGKKKLEFTVDLPQLQAKIDATVHQDTAGNVYDTAIHLKKLDLVSAQDGTSTATATVNWTTTYKPPTSACETKTYTGTFKTEVVARLDPADPTRVLVKASFIPGVLKHETLRCSGKSFPFTGGTTLGVWAYLGTEHAVTLGGSATINPPVPGGTSSVTTTITKKNP